VAADFGFCCGVQEAENLNEQFNSCKNERRLGDHLATGALGGRHYRICGNVPGAKVFGQK
jgi:hypothetical protein